MGFLDMAKAVIERRHAGYSASSSQAAVAQDCGLNSVRSIRPVDDAPGQLLTAASPTPTMDLVAKDLCDNAERLAGGPVGEPCPAELVGEWLADTAAAYVTPQVWLQFQSE
jgi:hypothetical protein